MAKVSTESFEKFVDLVKNNIRVGKLRVAESPNRALLERVCKLFNNPNIIIVSDEWRDDTTWRGDIFYIANLSEPPPPGYAYDRHYGTLVKKRNCCC